MTATPTPSPAQRIEGARRGIQMDPMNWDGLWAAGRPDDSTRIAREKVSSQECCKARPSSEFRDAGGFPFPPPLSVNEQISLWPPGGPPRDFPPP